MNVPGHRLVHLQEHAPTARDRPASVLVVGEALVDVVLRGDGRIVESPGGSPANVALALGRLGHGPQLLTTLADDARGRAVRSWLEASQVDVLCVRAPRTPTATARLDAAGSATYEFDLEWDLAGATAEGVGLVHTGSIAALIQPGAADVVRIVQELRDAALVTYDPNIRPALLGDRLVARDQVEALVALADLVKASDEDLAWLYPGIAPSDVARDWLAIGPAIVVITSGAAGAFAAAASGEISVEAEPVDVVDTVGAGDTFMSALIDGLLRSGYGDASARTRLRHIPLEDIVAMLQFGALAASMTVSRPGADPPRREELGLPPAAQTPHNDARSISTTPTDA